MSREQSFRHAVNALEPSSPLGPYLDRIYNNSRIDRRYFSVPDIGYEADLDGPEQGATNVNGGSEAARASGSTMAQEPPQAFYPGDGR